MVVTLSSCLIWQIISFILSPNEIYLCIRLYNAGKYCDITLKIIVMKMIFSDEAHFDLGGYCRIWGTENPHAYIEKTTHPNWVTVRILVQRHNWTIWSKVRPLQSMAFVTGPCWKNFFHKNWRGRYWQHLVSAGRRYVPHSRSYTRCFAPCFIISRRADVVWPPRSCDLTPLDYYLWGASKISVTPTSQRQSTLWRTIFVKQLVVKIGPIV